MKHAHGHAAGPETLATGVAGKIGGKSWSFGCNRARGDAQSQERCQMAQAAPQSGAHLRGRERDAVGSARAIASGKGFNDVVGAGAALADHRSTAGHDFMNTSDVQKQTTVG